jgi:hypothetical protein
MSTVRRAIMHSLQHRAILPRASSAHALGFFITIEVLDQAKTMILKPDWMDVTDASFGTDRAKLAFDTEGISQ